MLNFYAVIYDSDGKNKAKVVPKSWIYPKKKSYKLLERKYIFHHSDLNARLPSENMMATLIDIEYENKKEGYMYPATILKGFGE